MTLEGNTGIALALWLLGQPWLITLVVNKLKSVAWIAKNPKESATLLNVFANVVIGSILFHSLPLEANQALVQFVLAVAQSLGSTGYYEWIKPKATGLGVSPTIRP